MGTRFLMSKESPTPEQTKARYVSCNNPSDIIVSKAMDGLPQRMIMNQMLAELERAGTAKKLVIALRNGLKFRKFTGASIFSLLQSALAMSKSGDISPAQAIMSANAPMIIQKAMVDGSPDEGVLPSGQVAGVIDSLLSCEEIISGIVTEAEQRLAYLATLNQR
jgi:NAD(P)H-dependent flavin oxidoreductase YrpB (nitropropane dioxygenase family)